MKLGAQRIILVDTPGFDDTTRTEAEVLRELASWLQKTYQDGSRLSGLLYLHRIIDPRMSGSAMKSLSIFRKLVGHALSKVVLVTTHWDLIDPSLGKRREAELLSEREFWAPLIEQGGRAARFHGDRDSALAILGSCVSNQTFPLLIQEELVIEQKTLSETSAGQALYQEIERLKASNAAMIAEMHEEMKEALREKDYQYAKELANQEEKQTR